MAQCKRCAFDLPEGANYCPKCGEYAGKSIVEEFEVKSDELVKRIKDIIHEGNVTKIVVENERGETLLEMPATVGVVGALLAPWLAALGAIAAIATRCRIKVERRS